MARLKRLTIWFAQIAASASVGGAVFWWLSPRNIDDGLMNYALIAAMGFFTLFPGTWNQLRKIHYRRQRGFPSPVGNLDHWYWRTIVWANVTWGCYALALDPTEWMLFYTRFFICFLTIPILLEFHWDAFKKPEITNAAVCCFVWIVTIVVCSLNWSIPLTMISTDSHAWSLGANTDVNIEWILFVLASLASVGVVYGANRQLVKNRKLVKGGIQPDNDPLHTICQFIWLATMTLYFYQENQFANWELRPRQLFFWSSVASWFWNILVLLTLVWLPGKRLIERIKNFFDDQNWPPAGQAPGRQRRFS